MTKKSWTDMPLNERIEMVHVDIMRNHLFAPFGGICLAGSVITDEAKVFERFGGAVVTAATDGLDVWYWPEFTKKQSQKQLRYLVLHENGHKMLKHCVLPDYVAIAKKLAHTNAVGMATDYAVNGLIESLDPTHTFVEPPTIPPLYDKKYDGWSWIEILNDLIKNGKGGKGQGQPGSGKPGSGPPGGTLDVHVPNAQTEAGNEEERAKIERLIDDAVRQGEMLAKRLRGTERGGHKIGAAIQQRNTNYKDAIREWITTIVAGDDNSRFCPPNKRLLPWCIMPSHFSESTGTLVIAADTSGSMTGVYPTLFGEVARICENVKPERVIIIWWDNAVCSVQEFEPKEYDKIATLMKPKGGGGTTPSVVIDYIERKQIKPRGIIWLTDGYIGTEPKAIGIPYLWGIIDNEQFTATTGKTLHISSHSI